MMIRRSGTRRSTHEIKWLIEGAVADECRLAGRGLWFCVDEVQTSGHPPARIKVWATLHFTAPGSPYCCGEAGCHVGVFVEERMKRINDHVRRAMGLEQDVSIDFGDVGERIGVQYHEGVEFRDGG